MLQKHVLAQPEAFEYFFEHHPDGICLVDTDGHLVNVNASALKMLGYTREELLQSSLDLFLNCPGVNNHNTAGCGHARSELAIRHKRGYLVYVRWSSTPVVSDGKEIGRFITFEDVTPQREQRSELSDIQEMFTFISEKSQNIISSISPNGVFNYISPSVEALLGFTAEEVIGQPAFGFNHPDDNKRLEQLRSSVWVGQDTVSFTGRVRHKHGGYRWFETTVEYIRNSSGEIIQTVGVGRDITDRKEAEQTIAHLAHHDSLTDLPNRRWFNSQVNLLLKESPEALHGMMVLDLNEFKYVNDTYGHDVGDLLLIEVAKRLTHAVGEKGWVARWGGDEFTVIQMNIKGRSDVESLVTRIQETISEPMVCAGHTLHITAAVGVSMAPEQGDTVEALIRHADKAMYLAKKQPQHED